MADSIAPANRRPLLWIIDPRRSLVSGAVWLIIALAVTFSIAAAIWVGAIARQNLLAQHVRRLSLETDQLSSDVGQAIDARLAAVRGAARILRESGLGAGQLDLKEIFDELSTSYPQLDWIAIADSHGIVVDALGAPQNGRTVETSPWFRAGLQGPWLGVIESTTNTSASTASQLGDLAAPVRDDTGRVVGVVAAHLSWRRSADHPQRLTDESDQEIATQALVLDRNRVVLVGPREFLDRPWSGVPVDSPGRTGRDTDDLDATTGAPQFEQLASGRRVLVARSALSASNEVSATGWQVLLCEPNERVYRRADAVAIRILWVSLGLGILTALIGIVGARHLTRRLKVLALSVSKVGHDETAIEVPGGVDEVAQLGRAFAQILADLREERRELERRVAVRTREVERLAEESRYAAVVRERLKIARDLHDTLAHSMMAILSEIRLLRRLHARDPAALAAELERAEAVAHEGLAEARSAISQMRVSTVRETGLGPALAGAFDKFIDRTGLSGSFSAEEEAARFGDERGEAFLRITLEALRNIEKHAMATRAVVRLRIASGTHLQLLIEDNGVGFDPKAVLPDHFGIVGIREQADLIGAEVRIESVRNQGTTVVVSLPLSPVAFPRSP
jgi:signal transduction histidine kinase/outer membrane murein-binding lipoprotein Lpp